MTEFEEDVSASGVVIVGFAIATMALLVAMPPNAGQLRAADPLVQTAAMPLGTWTIPLISLLAPAAWWHRRRPRRIALARAARQTLGAFAAVAVALPALRLAVGPELPSFIPPEESARPGMALGLCAALLEEGVFRLAILAPIYAGVGGRRLPNTAAAAFAVVITALILAGTHEIGPGASASAGQFLASRFAVLGCSMGVLFVKPGPVFLVAGHCGAHVAIALLFTGAGS